MTWSDEPAAGGFDEALLDRPEQLERRDTHRLLWSLATAGAQVRRATETVGEAGFERLRGGDLPRAVLVAADGPADVGRLVTRLSGDRAPALPWHAPELPRWAGPADAILVASADGRDPGLAELSAQAVQRGMAFAAVAPAGSPVAAAVAGRAPLHELPRDLHPRALRWSVLVPLLLALDALGLHPVPSGLLVEVADGLDEQAEACRLFSDAFTNPAKALAAEFAETVPLVAGAGALAAVAARTVADTLQLFAGVPAVSAGLPDGLDRAATLLRAGGGTAGGDPDDFFRDRVAEPDRSRARLLVVGDDGAADDPLLGDRSDARLRFDELAARQAARTLRDLAEQLGLRVSGVEVPGGDPLVRYAAATAFGDFTAAYLAFGLGRDPGAPDPATELLR